MKKLILTVTLISSMALASCTTLQQGGQKELVGAATGAVLGGILGSKIGDGTGQLYATGIGVLLGTLVGSELGRSLDKADVAHATRANTQAHTAPLGEEIAWNNPETGNSGSVTAVKDGNDTAGRYCREYQQTIFVGGKQETGYGIACQQPDGSWQIVS